MDLLAFAKNIADRVEAQALRAKVPVAVCRDRHSRQRRTQAPDERSAGLLDRASPSAKPIRRRWWGCEQSTCFRLCSLASRSFR